jgi:hypothetical protein
VLTHPELDERSRALHRLVAEKIRLEPARFDRARQILERWRAIVSGDSQPYLLEWESLFRQGIEPTLGVAVEDSERADALRQCSPLAGVLTNQERWTFLREWGRHHDAQAT